MYVFLDTETTGLNDAACVPLELAIVVTDDHLDTLDEQSWLIYWPGITEYSVGYGIDDFVREMHIQSGLWNDLKQGPSWTCTEICNQAVEFIQRNGAASQPMAGSSVHFDRRYLAHFMQPLERMFSYRNIDVSSLKEIFLRVDPDVVESRPQPLGRHRALPDCYDTIQELNHYLQFMNWTPEVNP